MPSPRDVPVRSNILVDLAAYRERMRLSTSAASPAFGEASTNAWQIL